MEPIRINDSAHCTMCADGLGHGKRRNMARIKINGVAVCLIHDTAGSAQGWPAGLRSVNGTGE